jgi:serine phosphatase RsbU (regulator of sigma subunit)
MAGKLRNFWQRISDGIAIQHLWAQFRTDARSSYKLYSKDVDSTPIQGESRWKRLQSLRTLAALPGSLVELVGQVNRYSCEQSLNGRRFTTAFVAELEPVTGSLTYVNAGHNWPVLRRASGAIKRLEAENDQSHEYGEERMLPTVHALQNATANEALKRLMSSVDTFVGLMRQHDDITCLVLRMT